VCWSWFSLGNKASGVESPGPAKLKELSERLSIVGDSVIL